MKFGSVCSGIEAASVAFLPLNMEAAWFSEILEFPSKIIEKHYPFVTNYGDMQKLPALIKKGKVIIPDILCGGTPCQAFSLAGWKNGLIDERGILTLKFIDIANSIDLIRVEENKHKSVILWENVEGILKDKTNAFGIFLAGLAGLEEPLIKKKWPSAGLLFGKSRNIAWRILDAKYFALPQQRRRLFLIATDTIFNPGNILFEINSISNLNKNFQIYNNVNINNNQLNLFNYSLTEKKLVFNKFNNKIEFFRDYTDCLYSAYGTKWNGNAAAYNGSLFISQNNRLRRFTPLECERLMGFPDDYTYLPKAKDTSRYKAIGNSWPIPVIKWLGKRIKEFFTEKSLPQIDLTQISSSGDCHHKLFLFENDTFIMNQESFINVSPSPNTPVLGELINIVDVDAKEKFYLSTKGIKGIVRRKAERNINMNPSLEKVMSLDF